MAPRPPGEQIGFHKVSGQGQAGIQPLKFRSILETPLGLLVDRRQPLHFIGVGGIGMSALAEILVERGFSVSGSDPRDNSVLQGLRRRGVRVFQEQSPATIEAIRATAAADPQIVVSSAVPQTNPELAEARRLGLSVVHRSDVLAALINSHDAIAIAGSHGKTTTSTMVATLLAATANDPTAVIGGIVAGFGSNARVGNGRLLVAEADESDGSLVKFQPSLGLITNLELDHTDHYADLEALIGTLQQFASGCGTLLTNHDCPVLRERFRPDACWSTERADGVDFAAIALVEEGDGTVAEFYEQGTKVGQFRLPLPGRHNLSNATGALAACRLEGVPFEALCQAIPSLSAPGRRFDYRCSWQGRLVVDDYAHHPSEVHATLTMAQLMVSTGRSPLPAVPRRVVAVFQPHRYSRTAEFGEAFAQALGLADAVLLAPLYSAGEAPLPGVTSGSLGERIAALHPALEVRVAADMQDLAQDVATLSQDGDLVLAMGAGDVNGLWERLTGLPGAAVSTPLAA